MARKLDSRDKQEPQVSDEENPPPNEGATEERSLLDRRTYLGIGATAVSALNMATIGTALSSTESRHGINFGQTYNAVDDLGMDPTGEEPINAAVSETRDGDLLQFPTGDYRVNPTLPGLSLHDETRGFEGIDESVSFAAPQGMQGYLLDASEMDGGYIAGIDIDQCRPNSCGGIRLTGDRIVIKDLELSGRCDRSGGGIPLVSHSTIASDGQSFIDSILAKTGFGGRPALGRPGIFVEESHSGSLAVRNSHFSGFPNPAIYGGRHSGQIHVSNAVFKNNASAIRLSNGGSSVADSTIVINTLPYTLSPGVETNGFAHNGIAIGTERRDRTPTNPITITDTAVQIEDLPVSAPAIVGSTAGRPLNIKNSSITYNNDSQSVIRSRSPGETNQQPVGSLDVRNTTVSGDGSVDSVILAERADQTEIIDSSLQVSGSDSDGITITDSNNCKINGVGIDVPGRAAVITSSSVTGSSYTPHRANSTLGTESTASTGTNTVTIAGTEKPSTYEITVDGDLSASGITAEEHTSMGNTAEGVVKSEPVCYRVSGVVTDFQLDDDDRVFLNGDQIPPGQLGQGYPHRLGFDGTETPTTYSFSTGTISPGVPQSGTSEQVSVEGMNEKVEYRFAGPLESLSVTGTATLTFGPASSY